MEFSEKVDFLIVELLLRIGIPKGRIGVPAGSLIETSLRNALQEKGYECILLPYDASGQLLVLSGEYSAFILPCLGKNETMTTLLDILKKACEDHQAPLILTANNLTHNNMVLHLLFGKRPYISDCQESALYTEAELSELLNHHGFSQLENNDLRIDSSAKKPENKELYLQNEVLIHRYILWLRDRTDPASQVYTFVRAYSPSAFVKSNARGDEEDSTRPFLSVLTRTQGTRIDELAEVLLCLSGQTDDDFEVMIVGHKVTPERKKEIERVIGETPEYLRKRIRYLEIDTGNRSTPLNFGIRNAQGTYLTILDDDDLVLDHWVETFKEAHKTGSGTILHAYAVEQDWKRGALPGALFAVSSLGTLFCEPFDYLRQIVENRCPTLSLAFPTEVFNCFHRDFDESLDTTEDWDYLMFSAFLLGVTDIAKVTSIYRKWKNADSSASLYNNKQWEDNYYAIKRRLNAMPVLLPPGGAQTVDFYYKAATKQFDKITLTYNWNLEEEDKRFHLLAKLHQATLYYNSGEGFNENQLIRSDNQSDFPKFHFNYQFPANTAIGSVRFDPSDLGEICISNFSAYFVFEDKSTSQQFAEIAETSAFFIDDVLVFLLDDPQIIINVPKGLTPSGVIVCGEYMPLPRREERQMLWSSIKATTDTNPGLLKRLGRKVVNILGGNGNA